jgi:hypothetical protein
MTRDDDKGEWAETADEGIVPPKLGGDGDDDAPEVGRITGSDEPATAEGIDLGAGDHADAVTDGGPKPPEDAEPDLKDAGAVPRSLDR